MKTNCPQIYNDTIDKENYRAVKWDESYFKYCDIKKFQIEGGLISSDFISCTFNEIDWYWGIFTLANFIQCQFENCTFQGTSFVDARFVECSFKNCRFIKDNLGSDCNFNGSIAYSCKIENTIGFEANSAT